MREQKIELREVGSEYCTGSEYDNASSSGGKTQPKTKSWPVTQLQHPGNGIESTVGQNPGHNDLTGNQRRHQSGGTA